MNDENQKNTMTSERALGFQAHYSRLFGERFPGHDRDKLITLAGRMKALPGSATDLSTISSMMVYFGQFIDHDITRDRTKLDETPYPEPKHTRNDRNPCLNLDSLYADGPGGQCNTSHGGGCAIYESSRPGAERFVLVPVGGAGADIPRDSSANPLIGDPRNDENLIISQLHVLFMKFHNRVVELLEDTGLSFPAPGAGTIFERARRFVTWHYQWLVREVFLKMIIHRKVFSELAAPNSRPRLFDVGYDTVVDLPVEFTMAAFRFGHSMVRDAYDLNPQKLSVALAKILNIEARCLEPENIIDWSTFATNDAQAIDRTIALGLYDLSNRIVTLHIGPGSPNEFALPARTLIRGSNVGLPSGQAACQRAGIPVIAFNKSDRDYECLQELDMLYRTPLWYYLLYEAEMIGTDDAGHGSLTLGPLGSQIVGEVFLALLKSDKDAYVHHYWEPPAFSVRPGAPKETINSFERLIAFATGQ